MSRSVRQVVVIGYLKITIKEVLVQTFNLKHNYEYIMYNECIRIKIYCLLFNIFIKTSLIRLNGFILKEKLA